MNAENTKGKVEFIIDHIWWAFIAWIWYKNIIFRCLGTHSLNESRWILFGCIVGCFVLGMILQWKKMRNSISVFANISAGFGIYTVLTYLPIKRKLIIITFLIATVLALAYAALILCPKIKNKRKFKKIMIRRIKWSLIGGRNAICAGLLAIMVMIGANSIFGFSLLTPSVSPAKQSNVEEQTIANNIETLALLYDGTWSTLSVDEKLNVLQTVANVEQRYLGLPNELNVGAENLREGLAGYYSDRNHMIVVSLDCLLNDSSYELVDTIAHEAYHSLQHRMIDAYEEASNEMKPLYLYYDATIYREEFANYIDGKEDLCSYYTQSVEIDARRYARSAANEYFERIYEYLGIRTSSGSADDAQVIYDDGEAYLVDDNGSRIAGPYQFIEASPYGSSSYYRYVGANGRIGYLDCKGNQVTEPIYLEGTDLSVGAALVRENEESCYYINTNGDRISQDFVDGGEFDYYGSFARVLTDDGKWGIIDSSGTIIYSGADKINEAWDPFYYTTAIIDGDAVLIRLISADAETDAEAHVEVIATFEGCSDISEIHRSEFAIITDNSGNSGVIGIDGNILIPMEYAEVDYEILYGYGADKEVVVFRLEGSDGTHSFMNIEF